MLNLVSMVGWGKWTNLILYTAYVTLSQCGSLKVVHLWERLKLSLVHHLSGTIVFATFLPHLLTWLGIYSTYCIWYNMICLPADETVNLAPACQTVSGVHSLLFWQAALCWGQKRPLTPIAVEGNVKVERWDYMQSLNPPEDKNETALISRSMEIHWQAVWRL